MRNGLLAFLFFSATMAWAIPEADLPARTPTSIIPQILESEGQKAGGHHALAHTGVAALDQLWEARTDLRSGECSAARNDCRVLSVFQGKASDYPVVLLTGFTGYRKMFLEQIYDLIEAGYGPIYVSDFAGGGESYRPELKPGQSVPTVERFLEIYKKDGAKKSFEKKLRELAGPNADAVRPILLQQPLGSGHIRRFSDYIHDVNFIMGVAAAQNPERRLIGAALSSSALALLLSLTQDATKQTWIPRVERLILESPMLKVNTAGVPGGVLEFVANLGKLFKGEKKIVAPNKGVTEFVNKSLGGFNVDNRISQSHKRMALMDSLRVWNGYETAGATFGWAVTEFNAQYSFGIMDTGGRKLNKAIPAIAKTLKTYDISLVSAVSRADTLVDPKAAERFHKQLTKAGIQNTWLCSFDSARHVLSLETDKYRAPYMAFLADQKNPVVSAAYGDDPGHEALRCARAPK